MEKYVTKDLSKFVSNNSSWKIFDENKPHNEDFILLFNHFKPIDKVLSISSKINRPKTNIVWVHNGITLMVYLNIGKNDVVKQLYFGPDKKLVEPFAVYVRDYKMIENGDGAFSILNKIIAQKHAIRRV